MSGSLALQVKRFLFRFILIGLVIFICDLGIGNILKFFYFRQTSGLLYRTTYETYNTNAKLLVSVNFFKGACLFNANEFEAVK